MTNQNRMPSRRTPCLLLMISLLIFAVVSQNAGEAESATAENRNLIVYFAVAENSEVDAVSSASVLTENGESRGLIRVLADFIHENVGGDFFPIETSVAYPADIGALIQYASGEQAESVRPELISNIEDLSAYDTLFIGYPNWWYDLPMVMYSFFEAYDFSGKTIIPFCTHNGSRFSSTIQTIEALEPDAIVITEGFTISQNDVKGAGDAVKSWLGELGF